MQAIKRSFRGFSLIEVLIALVILSVGIISLANFQTDLIRGNTLAKERTEAVVLAQNKIEEARRLFSENPDKIDAFIADLNNTTLSGDNTNFTIGIRKDAMKNGDVVLHLSVTWNDLESNNRVTNDSIVYLTSAVSKQPYDVAALPLKPSTSVELTTTTTTTTTTSTTTTTVATTTTTTLPACARGGGRRRSKSGMMGGCGGMM